MSSFYFVSLFLIFIPTLSIRCCSCRWQQRNFCLKWASNVGVCIQAYNFSSSTFRRKCGTWWEHRVYKRWQRQIKRAQVECIEMHMVETFHSDNQMTKTSLDSNSHCLQTHTYRYTRQVTLCVPVYTECPCLKRKIGERLFFFKGNQFSFFFW